MTQPPFPPPPPSGPPPSGPPPAWGPPPAFPQAPPPRRRTNPLVVVLAVLVSLVVVGVAVLVPLVLNARDDDEGRSGSTGASDSGVSDQEGLGDVAEYDGLSNQHLEVGEDHDYPQSPPVGGEHAPFWLDCGVYDDELPEVSVVHDLEHGTVWITYREDLVGGEDLERLVGLLPDNGILSPYPDQEAPVVVTVWERQLELTGPDDDRLPLFIEEYGAGETAPEPFASCHGGVSLDDLGTGGVSA